MSGTAQQLTLYECDERDRWDVSLRCHRGSEHVGLHYDKRHDAHFFGRGLLGFNGVFIELPLVVPDDPPGDQPARLP